MMEQTMLAKNNCNGNGSSNGCENGGLLVDFPQEIKNKKRSSSSPSVRFTAYSCMILIDCPDKDEMRKRWYTEENYSTFKRLKRKQVFRDILPMISKVVTSPADLRSDDVLLCIGMEKYLTIDTNRIVRRKQAKHVRTILDEQERQDMRGIVDVDALARLSYASSEWTRHRSHRYAASYLKNEV